MKRGTARENATHRTPKDPVNTAEPRENTARPAEGPATIRAGCIGRGNAGKTALFRALTEGPIGDFLPSGLHVDAGDPREVAQMIREADETQRMLHLAGLPPTLVASQIRYYLYEGAEQRAAYYMHEVIGQVLTHTLPDSATEQQTLYDEYLRNLVNTEVLWVVVPSPPPSPTSRERRRYANDLRITLAYLREALRLRSLQEPVAVALVLSKIDTLFKDGDEARAALNDPVLHRALGPLVDLIETSDRVSEAAIIPVSAFGFGNAVQQEEGVKREGMPGEQHDDPYGHEPIWILREGAEAVPFNLDGLFVWTLLNGMRERTGCEPGVNNKGARRICELLESDLNGSDSWILPLKQADSTSHRSDELESARSAARLYADAERQIA